MCVWVSRVWGGRCAPLSECATEISGGTKCTGHSRLAISEAHEVASGNACMQCHQSFESCAGALASSSLRLWVVMSPWIWIDQGYAIHQFRAFLFEARLEKFPVWYLFFQEVLGTLILDSMFTKFLNIFTITFQIEIQVNLKNTLKFAWFVYVKNQL